MQQVVLPKFISAGQANLISIFILVSKDCKGETSISVFAFYVIVHHLMTDVIVNVLNKLI